MRLPIPKGLERRLRPLMRKGEEFLRQWEWTWAKAWTFGLILAFFAVGVLAVAPSWMLYFADQTLKWRSRLLISVRDIIVNGWFGFWIAFFIVAFYWLQKITKRVKGERQSERYSGGYR